MEDPSEVNERNERWIESEFIEMMNVLRTTDSSDILDGVRSGLNQNIQQATLNPKFATRGFEASPLHELYTRLTYVPLSLHTATDDFLRPVLAYRRNITNILHKHVDKRREWGGNVVFEWTGPTGLGKSSCMIGFMERHNGLHETILNEGTEGLRRHIAIDITSLPRKVEQLKAGQAVGMDEQLHLVGEGARNSMDTLANLEETLRGTGIDIHFASPSLREHTTSQGILEAISWNREKKLTAFLVKLAMNGNPKPMPLGYVVLPWCSPEAYAAYEPIKKENLERTKRMQFNQSAETQHELIRTFFEIPSIQTRFKHLNPKKDDIARWWSEVMPSTGLNEAATYAATAFDMIRLARAGGTAFRDVYGWDPRPNILKAAKKGNGAQKTGLKTW